MIHWHFRISFDFIVLIFLLWRNSMLKKFMSISAAFVTSVGMLLSVPAFVQAETHDVELTLASIESIQTKASTIAAKMDPNYPILIQMFLSQPAVFGIDIAKPMGLIADMPEDGFAYTIFLPVKNKTMFETQLGKLQEDGKISEDVKVEFKNDFAVCCMNMEWTDDVPEFDGSKVLSLNARPEALAPLLGMLVVLNPDMKPEQIEQMQKNMAQMESFTMDLDISNAGDLELAFTQVPKEGTDIAQNFANSEKLTKSVLCNLCDENAPFTVQVLGAFDENNRRDLVTSLTSEEIISEKLREAILLAMDVEKVDFVLSADGESLIAAMGISNGDEINKMIVEAIEEMEEDGDVTGTANAGKIGKSIVIHELQHAVSGQSIAIGVHKKYIFVAAAKSQKASTLLKKTLKANPLKVGTVDKNGNVTFDMDFVASLNPALADLGLDGKVTYVVDVNDGQLAGTFQIESAVFESIGKIIKNIQVSTSVDMEGEASDGDLFEDDEE